MEYLIKYGTREVDVCDDCRQLTNGFGGKIDGIPYCDDCLDLREDQLTASPRLQGKPAAIR